MPNVLYATIKRSSKYYHQQRTTTDRIKTPIPFEVEIADPHGYCVHGNGNQYRIEDLNWYVMTEGGLARLSGR